MNGQIRNGLPHECEPGAVTVRDNKSSGVPMPGMDKGTGRVTALIVLVILAALALRGYLPGDEQASRAQSHSGPASLIAVVALLGVSTATFALGIIASLRRRRAGQTSVQGLPDLPDGLGGESGGSRWRWLLIGIGVVLALLVITVLLARVYVPPIVDPPPLNTGSADVPVNDNPAPPPPSEEPEAGGDVVGYLIAASAITFVFLAVGIAVTVSRKRRVAKPYVPADKPYPAPAAPPEPQSLARAAELGLAEVGDLNREPRQAIIACYAAMEHGLAKAPEAIPQDSDTPTEVLARAVEHHALHADSAAELVDLFAEARFSPHVMTEIHREVAVRALRVVLAELKAMA